MSRSFLIGKFLPAYAGRFGRLPDRKLTSDGLPPDVLQARFSERGL
ncbi:MAG: hypothetical protein O3C45_08800 [Bacteroidetes bacterium]|nr:hypothetical protein [Bacteroidota bacterium]